jgi:maltose/moltooligosaccharide transporter
MTRARLSLFQTWNMCFGFFGIQIGFALQNANASRLFQTLGADVSGLAILWIAAPLTGLLVQPLIGYWSDRTWTRLGRRRPFLLVGALLTTAALVILPNSPSLWIAAGALWLLDASINVTMEPFRAFVADQMPDEQRTSGYAMQSFFIGAGAVFASCLPWLLSQIASAAEPAGGVPWTVKLSFYIGAAALLGAVLWTVFTTREYSPDEIAAFDRARPAASAAERPPGPAPGRYLAAGAGAIAAGAALAALTVSAGLEKELYLLAALTAGLGAVLLGVGLHRRSGGRPGPLSEICEDVFRMPPAMRQLALVQLFSWFGLFAMWIYTTPAVTAVHFAAPVAGSPGYNQGADWVGVLFGVYNGVAACAALLLPILARRAGRPLTHALNLLLGAAGLLSFFFIRDPGLLWIGMIGVGFAWASILSAPYAMLSAALPSAKVGLYMGVFNIFIVLPQLVAATVLGLVLRVFFQGQAIWALALGAASLVIAALCALAIRDPAGRTSPAPALAATT